MIDTSTVREKYSLNRAKLSDRVRDALLDLIESGHFGKEGKLPPEPDLAKELGVGRTTLRLALEYLENRKVIRRQAGVGTFVNASGMRIKTNIAEVTGFKRLIRESGHQSGIGEQSITTPILPAKAQRKLRLSGPEKGLVVERVFLADDEPAIFCSDMVPFSVLSPDAETGFTAKEGAVGYSIFEFLADYGLERADYGVAEIVPVVASVNIAKRLGLKTGTACLLIEETYMSADGVPLVYSNMYFRDEIIRFKCLRPIR